MSRPVHVYVPNADAVTLTVEFEGFFAPVLEPVVGAIALATQSVTIVA